MINKILIIDDNIIFCNAVKYHFLQKEYYVEICISYSEFQNKKNIEEFDLILLDMKLNDSTGLDFLKYISGKKQNQKVIIVSSFLEATDIKESSSISRLNRCPRFKLLLLDSEALTAVEDKKKTIVK